MNKIKNLIKTGYITTLILLFNAVIVNAEVKFNPREADKVKTNILTPATAWFMGIVGGVGLLACAIQYVRWVLKDEEEREQKPYWKTVKPIIVGLIIVESISSILLIFSIVV